MHSLPDHGFTLCTAFRGEPAKGNLYFVAAYWVRVAEDRGASLLLFESEEAARAVAEQIPREQAGGATMVRASRWARSWNTPAGPLRQSGKGGRETCPALAVWRLNTRAALGWPKHSTQPRWALGAATCGPSRHQTIRAATDKTLSPRVEAS
jgi:hypothetical protein